ncbi:hypothetical protein FOE78_08290 [Microlunatus elymi]|uniref:Transcriptional regulator, AbiEi antitoxin, Type IV TA system n=1 Tax=Microlunatus elymi TaxID=2596828 RepID=A0A516PXJ9_9ACTN|nr:hypothetical protein [Microlunatus elymi]QDP95897.1 hypothetical protein FOE78_08290 [Microlunatus elymi]
MPPSRFEQELQHTITPLTATSLKSRGITQARLGGKAWRRIGQGLYLPSAEVNAGAPIPTAQRVLNARPLLAADAALGGWAAAYVLGVDWLDGMDPWTRQLLPIDLVGTSRRQSHDLIRYRFARQKPRVIIRHGIPITAPLQTAADGARWAGTVEEALVFLDAMVRFEVVGPRRLLAHLDRLKSLQGLGHARAAARLTRPNVWSPWESGLRYCYRIQAGLPEPLINVRLFDDDGVFLGNPDLFDPDAALGVEFDGEHHRDRHQHRRDNIREERFESVGVTVVRADSLDLRWRKRPSLIRRMIDGYHRGQRRDRSHDRWMIDPSGGYE